jgi:hypothetical protein
MTKFLKKYIKEIEEILEGENKKVDWKKTLNTHRVTIGFFQHERLIHLLVTLAFGIKFLVAMILTLIYPQPVLLMVDGLLLILLVPYLFHYFRLENGVQKLYWIDKKIEKRV